MRICFIAPETYELFNEEYKTGFGGAEVQMYLLAIAFAKQKLAEVHFIVADYGQPKMVEHIGVKVWKSFKWNDFILKKILKFYAAFYTINADVYFQMTLTPFSPMIALYCKLLKKKLIYLLAHDNEVEQLKKNFINKMIWKFSQLVFRFSTINISQNQYQHQKLCSLGFKSKIIRSSFHIDKQAINKPKYHLWVARAEKWKRPELFISLAKSFPNEKFYMVCPKSREIGDEYFKSVIGEASKVENLTFIENYISFSSLDSIFENAKSFVITSIQEGFATTLIHACKFGVPILSLNVNPDNFITNSKCGFYCNDNMNEFTENFSLMNSNNDLYNEFSMNAKKYILENHDIEENVRKFADLIQI